MFASATIIILRQGSPDYFLVPAGQCAIFEYQPQGGHPRSASGIKLWEVDSGSTSSLEYVALAPANASSSGTYNSPSIFKTCDGDSFDINTCWDGLSSIRAGGFMTPDTCYNGSVVPPIVFDMQMALPTRDDTDNENKNKKSAPTGVCTNVEVGRSYVYVKNGDSGDTVVAAQVSELPFDCSSDDLDNNSFDLNGWSPWITMVIAMLTFLITLANCYLARTYFNTPCANHTTKAPRPVHHTSECRIVEDEVEGNFARRNSSRSLSDLMCWSRRITGQRRPEVQIAIERFQCITTVTVQPEQVQTGSMRSDFSSNSTSSQLQDQARLQGVPDCEQGSIPIAQPSLELNMLGRQGRVP